ncbi:hypothetical protein C6P46_002823 [Rhodotorula mucilaginosa]|uniref:S-adenosylmethionine-dependent methyltransferase n=1 Tax=Rhodotorula mucilaginosa TaxID=5537 RepID=A0A9P6W5N0_RHOMI|nr:hypothetical protein C6P46_002823 [Rhodotorula mucilaginosa]TKA52339.1 hypothetical protein B0A53_04807 [Rhodotorula sp. CCFEE 5036]
MHSSHPSTALPALAPTSPPPAALALSIDYLDALLFPAQPIIDLRVPLAPIHSEDHDSTMLDQEEEEETGEDDDDVGMDAFEIDFARDWLNRIVAIGTRKCARGEDETGAWEGVVDRAAKLLTDLSGPGAQGASMRTYILPRPGPQTKPVSESLVPPPPAASSFYPTPPPTRPPSVVATRDRAPLELTLRDGTQLEASTGHRTWAAATLFARLLATRPGDFFPSSSSDKSDAAPLRILEVGSGTGLVGMTAAKVLEALGRRGEATLSDGGDEPDAVLENLRYNVAANFPPKSAHSSGNVEVGVRALDWRDFVRVTPNDGSALSSSPENTTSDQTTTRYHTILGSDLAYERGQATLLHAAVAAHLEFPTRTNDKAGHSDVPTFHLMLPLRPTHRIEMEEVESLFPPAGGSSHPVAGDHFARRPSDGEQFSFRLVTLSRERFAASTGFGGAGSRGGGARNAQQQGGDVTTYELRRIVWEAVDSPAIAWKLY